MAAASRCVAVADVVGELGFEVAGLVAAVGHVPGADGAVTTVVVATSFHGNLLGLRRARCADDFFIVARANFCANSQL